eukprot:scaffold6439_cov167-Amphora_coffeaeformis.AAC.2
MGWQAWEDAQSWKVQNRSGVFSGKHERILTRLRVLLHTKEVLDEFKANHTWKQLLELDSSALIETLGIHHFQSQPAISANQTVRIVINN